MPDSKRPVFIVSLLLLVTSTHADTLTGQVVAVADGDTITVLDANRHQERIRFQGIDAPERAQAFGQVSKKHLAGLVFGKQSRCSTPSIEGGSTQFSYASLTGCPSSLEYLPAS